MCEQTSQMYKSSWIPIRVIVFCTCEHSSFRKRVKYKGRGGTIEVKMLQVSRLKRRHQKKKKKKKSQWGFLFDILHPFFSGYKRKTSFSLLLH